MSKRKSLQKKEHSQKEKRAKGKIAKRGTRAKGNASKRKSEQREKLAKGTLVKEAQAKGKIAKTPMDTHATEQQDTQNAPSRLHIGCHLSASKGYVSMGKTALSIGADTFAFFTRNPRGGKARALDITDVEAFNQLAAKNNFVQLVAHAPYTLNAAAKDDRVREFALMTLADDLKRMEATPGQLYNFHPGSHVGQGAKEGIAKIAEVLNEVLAPDQTTTVLLETMAGKGTEVGQSFEELAAIISHVQLVDHIGVCLDTCHIWDSGYNIADQLDQVLDEFDCIVGLDKLKAVHLNDSKNPCGAHKDRHECIGEGFIGFDALSAVTRHPALRNLPFILETPNELLGYANEIARLQAAWT